MSDIPTEEVKQPQEPAPEAATPAEAASSWSMSSWLNSAKQKTLETAALMKKDLSELKEVMTSEVTELTTAAKGSLDSTVNVVMQQVQNLVGPDEEEGVEKAKEADATADPTDEKESEFPDMLAKMEKSASMGFSWMKNVVGSVADTVKSLAVEETYKDEDEFTEVVKYGCGRKTIVSKIVLTKIQTNDNTFLEAPADEKAFAEWLEKFSMTEHDGEVNILLANNPGLRAKFTKMVPASVDYATFWSRYFYAVYLAEIDAQMSEALFHGGCEAKGTENVVVEQPTSPCHSTDDWSVCSEKNEVEEISSTPSENSGPGTPQPEEKQKDGGWVDWDE